jgi:hypothetical protein
MRQINQRMTAALANPCPTPASQADYTATLEGPEVDAAKAPAPIRFKDTYAGETPYRKGTKIDPPAAEGQRAEAHRFMKLPQKKDLR